jgi:hypothetical protein
MIATYHIKWGTKREVWLQGPRNKVGAKLDPLHKCGIKQINIMFQLPYWEVTIYFDLTFVINFYYNCFDKVDHEHESFKIVYNFIHFFVC